jgi:hypothetical protein
MNTGSIGLPVIFELLNDLVPWAQSFPGIADLPALQEKTLLSAGAGIRPIFRPKLACVSHDYLLRWKYSFLLLLQFGRG